MKPSLPFQGAEGEPGRQSRRRRKVLLDLWFWIPGSTSRPRNDGVIDPAAVAPRITELGRDGPGKILYRARGLREDHALTTEAGSLYRRHVFRRMEYGRPGRHNCEL